ncbi:MAG: site-specific DNA-methyltransferase [Campylobacter concisus]|nr:site-specific DNA-methyltransferase [Campylobacter concisus]
MEIKYKKIGELTPYINNARTHSDEQVDQIVASIKEFGFTNPLLIDEKGEIIAGHGRLTAAKKLNMDEVPTIELKGLSEAQKRAYVIADNKLALNAGWDEELLKAELEALQNLDFDLELTGFSEDELADMGILQGADEYQNLDKSREDDIPPMDEKNIVVCKGDLIEFDKHRLLCGDSTNIKDVERLLNGRQADMVWTDPLYNVAVENSAGKILNDDMSKGEFREFLISIFKNYFQIVKKGGVIYVAHSESERSAFTETFIQAGFKFTQNLIWNKNQANLSRQDYNWKHEPILYGWKEGQGHYFCEDYSETTVVEDKINLTAMKKEELIDLAKKLLEQKRADVIDYDKPQKSELHPTMKPVGLVQRFIENSSRERELVVDLFGGAGSTLIASINANRTCYLMELDERYAQVIVQRYVDYTNNPKIKINGKEVDWYEYKEAANG